MSHLLLFVIGVLLLCVTALAALWMAGQLLVGLGTLLTGAAGVVLQLLWFGALALLLGGVTYFIAHAWRPGKPVSTLSGAPAPAPAAPSSFWKRKKAPTQTVIAAQPSLTVSETPAQPPSDS